MGHERSMLLGQPHPAAGSTFSIQRWRHRVTRMTARRADCLGRSRGHQCDSSMTESIQAFGVFIWIWLGRLDRRTVSSISWGTSSYCDDAPTSFFFKKKKQTNNRVSIDSDASFTFSQFFWWRGFLLNPTIFWGVTTDFLFQAKHGVRSQPIDWTRRLVLNPWGSQGFCSTEENESFGWRLSSIVMGPDHSTSIYPNDGLNLSVGKRHLTSLESFRCFVSCFFLIFSLFFFHDPVLFLG